VLLSQQAPQSIDTFLSTAAELEKQGDYGGAEKVYQEALAASPGQAEIMKRLGIVYQSELKFPESLGAFQKVIASNPQYPEVNFYLALSYFGLNAFGKALLIFDAEIKVH